MNDQTEDELAVLLRENQPLEVGGKTVTVRPIRLRVLSPFAQAILPIANAVAPMVDGLRDVAAIRLDVLNLQDVVVWHGPDLIRALSLATGETEEWVGELDLDETVQLAAEVLAVNADFFVKRLVPTIKGALGRIGEAWGKGGSAAGPTPGSSSSSTDTAAPT